jgi:hypothetical protein
MNRRQKIALLLLLAPIFVLGVYVFRFVPVGYQIASEQRDWCFPIKRHYYPFRYWQWSGIGPFYGGWLPDPHFVCSEATPVPTSIKTLLDDPSARYQLIDVNPFFGNESQEILLVIESNSAIYEFRLEFPRPSNIRSGILTSHDFYIKLFALESQIAVLSNFSYLVQGYYLVPVPLRSNLTLPLHRPGSDVYYRVTDYFSKQPDDAGELKKQFCGSKSQGLIGFNHFVAFYRKYRGPCRVILDEDLRSRDNELTRFEEWWAVP